MSYHPTRKATIRAMAALAVLTASVAGCTRGSESSGSTSVGESSKAGCPAVLAKAKKAVAGAEAVDAPWGGPTTGPKAVPGKTVVYVAQSMTNPGVAGCRRRRQGGRQGHRLEGADHRRPGHPGRYPGRRQPGRRREARRHRPVRLRPQVDRTAGRAGQRRRHPAHRLARRRHPRAQQGPEALQQHHHQGRGRREDQRRLGHQPVQRPGRMWWSSPMPPSRSPRASRT